MQNILISQPYPFDDVACRLSAFPFQEGWCSPIAARWKSKRCWHDPERSEETSPLAYDPSMVISIAIPVFNGAEYLEETLKSVLLQSHPCLEVVVVDEASPGLFFRKSFSWSVKE